MSDEYKIGNLRNFPRRAYVPRAVFPDQLLLVNIRMIGKIDDGWGERFPNLASCVCSDSPIFLWNLLTTKIIVLKLRPNTAMCYFRKHTFLREHSLVTKTRFKSCKTSRNVLEIRTWSKEGGHKMLQKGPENRWRKFLIFLKEKEIQKSCGLVDTKFANTVAKFGHQ